MQSGTDSFSATFSALMQVSEIGMGGTNVFDHFMQVRWVLVTLCILDFGGSCFKVGF